MRLCNTTPSLMTSGLLKRNPRCVIIVTHSNILNAAKIYLIRLYISVSILAKSPVYEGLISRQSSMVMLESISLRAKHSPEPAGGKLVNFVFK